MRRKDREMDKEFGLKIIDKSKYGVLSMVDEENKPFGLPLSIVRDGDNLYFHSAQGGRKVDILKRNPNVSIAFIGHIQVPENFTEDELKSMAKDESKATVFISSVFTTEYESAIVEGKAKLIKDEEEKIKAMRLICEKYTPSKMDYFNIAIKAGLKKANLYKIEIERLTAKRKKYDKGGKEMKYGRMEE